MYETLALSAIHLSIKHPSKSELYLTESTTLQAKALSLFNYTNQTISQETIIPAFLFSAVLGLHVFCDTFLTPSPDLNTFLDRLVQSIRILGGVRALVGDSWEYIKNSDLKDLLLDEPVVNRDDEVTHTLEDLHASFSQSRTLSAFESKVYCEAISGLIKVYSSNSSLGSSDGFISWQISVSAEYTELINERKPEALVVLAYFSIVLHTKRAFWAVGNAGRLLLTAIEEYLGEEWIEWLVVPKRIVASL
jgi:hypothetical protein